MEQTSLEEEDVGGEKEREVEHGGKESKVENPLEKYMKMVLEAREKQQVRVSSTTLAYLFSLFFFLCLCIF